MDWKERIEAGKPTKLDLLISELYSQLLIIKHNFHTKPLKTGIGAFLAVIGALWILWECVEKPKFVFFYVLIFLAMFLIGKKKNRSNNAN